MKNYKVGDRGSVTVDNFTCSNCNELFVLNNNIFNTIYLGHIEVEGYIKHKFKIIEDIIICPHCYSVTKFFADDCEDYILQLSLEKDISVNV